MNNAGIWTYGPLIGAADADIDRRLAVNVIGTLNCCQAFVPGVAGTARADGALRRIGTPTDIANAVGFLVSDQASYISGQILYVDGGLTAPTR